MEIVNGVTGALMLPEPPVPPAARWASVLASFTKSNKSISRLFVIAVVVIVVEDATTRFGVRSEHIFGMN